MSPGHETRDQSVGDRVTTNTYSNAAVPGVSMRPQRQPMTQPLQPPRKRGCVRVCDALRHGFAEINCIKHFVSESGEALCPVCDDAANAISSAAMIETEGYESGIDSPTSS